VTASQGPSSSTAGSQHDLRDGAVVIAAITSCTNTSNPAVMIARRPAGPQRPCQGPEREALGQDSLAPGSQVVTDYLERADLRSTSSAGLPDRRLRLHHLHRQLRPAAPEVAQAVESGDLVAAPC
jgi:aconitate hydratase